MASRWWVIGGVGVMTMTLFFCLWLVFADGYVRLFMDVAVSHFICWTTPNVAAETVLAM